MLVKDKLMFYIKYMGRNYKLDKVNTINWFFGRGLSIECNLTWPE